MAKWKFCCVQVCKSGIPSAADGCGAAESYNFLLLIPSLQENAECSLKEELRTVVVSEQIRQIYGQRFYVQATADDLILVILTQETDEAEELREMCSAQSSCMMRCI